ncbi:hypothetical protein GCM10010156_56750 [Planobispora rosea]|uniref:DUF8094 domain-containing protein n=1 Tax=Planobispora rosea TaxID=35762 RepID=A0A8J3S6J4_PLARO|nr:hypothetical protein [Planobispora rosea]GGS91085.1 hypothetical protein GCM10010156_56750 [Planobispora rosea]GIH86901.1 hypothetical protein Pro02_53090 [Planobispora rosea]
MPRRLFALLLGLCAVTGCGVPSEERAVPETGASPKASARTIERAEAVQAFELLQQLDDAWRDRDCAAVEQLTTWAENTLGGRACEATRNGRPAPTREEYGDPEFFLPAEAGEDRWFVALAREPRPAYFLFVHEDERWRLAAGPIPADGGDAPEPRGGAVPSGDPSTGVKARLVPQRYLTYLTDPAGVSGVRFPKGDVAAELLAELGRRPGTVRPDRLTTDVRLLVGPQRALLLPGGGALVVHALEIEYRQRPGAGRSSLARPIYGKDDLRGFTGSVRAPELTGTEIVLLVTEITGEGKVSTVAVRRGLASLTTG